MRSGSMVGVNRSFFLLLFFYLNLCFSFGKSARKDSFIGGLNDMISECRGGRLRSTQRIQEVIWKDESEKDIGYRKNRWRIPGCRMHS